MSWLLGRLCCRRYLRAHGDVPVSFSPLLPPGDPWRRVLCRVLCRVLFHTRAELCSGFTTKLWPKLPAVLCALGSPQGLPPG